MITREMVSEKLLAYLDDQLSLNQIVEWADQVMRDGHFAPDSNIESLVNIVMCLAETEHPQVPSARDGRSTWMTRPEMAAMVVPVDAA